MSKDKHEILFTRFGINYNNIDARLRKGSVLYREVGALFGSYRRNNNRAIKTQVLPESDHTIHDPPKKTPKEIIEGDTQQIEDISLHTMTADEGTSEGRRKQTPSDDVKEVKRRKGKQRQRPVKTAINTHHCDIIKDEFWSHQPWILEGD